MESIKLKDIYIEGIIYLQLPIADNYGPLMKLSHSYDFKLDKKIIRDCYIDEFFLEEVIFQKDNEREKWKVRVKLSKLYDERVYNKIFKGICRELSLNYLLDQAVFIQNGSFPMFCYDYNSLRVWGFTEDLQTFTMAPSAKVTQTEITLDNIIRDPLLNKVFDLSNQIGNYSHFTQELISAFLAIGNAKDVISRYLLSYYVLELIYSTQQYKEQEERYRKEHQIKKISKYRNEILHSYLTKDLELTYFHGSSEKERISKEILQKIILTRNNLTHAANIEDVPNTLYNLLIPLVKAIVIKFIEKDKKLN